jgi:hypothetical protein
VSGGTAIATDREAGQVDAVRDDHDLRRVVAVADEPALHRLGIHQHAIGETADVALDAPLHRGEIRTAVADRGDHYRG